MAIPPPHVRRVTNSSLTNLELSALFRGFEDCVQPQTNHQMLYLFSPVTESIVEFKAICEALTWLMQWVSNWQAHLLIFLILIPKHVYITNSTVTISYQVKLTAIEQLPVSQRTSFTSFSMTVNTKQWHIICFCALGKIV